MKIILKYLFVISYSNNYDQLPINTGVEETIQTFKLKQLTGYIEIGSYIRLLTSS